MPIETDTDAFLAGLADAIADLTQDAQGVVQDVGEEVAATAQSYAPTAAFDPHEAPGTLAASIFSEAGQDERGFYVDVGTTVPYAIFVEYGTYKDAAQPFMRPALGLASKALGLSKRSSRARKFSSRAVKRTAIRKLFKAGKISGREARLQSKILSSVGRYRSRR